MLSFCLSAITIHAQIPSSGLVGRWSFNNGNANSDIGGFNGVLTGTGVAPTTDRFGNTSKAMSFNGVHHIELNNISALNGTPQYTVSMWVNATDANSRGLWFKGVNPSTTTFNVAGWQGSGRIGMTHARTTGAATAELAYNAPTINAWHHIVWLYDGTQSTPTWSMYINGAPASTPSASNAPQAITMSNNSPFLLGAQGVAAAPFLGKLDDVCIYDRILTTTEIMQLYLDPAPEAGIASGPMFMHGVASSTPIGSGITSGESYRDAAGNTYLFGSVSGPSDIIAYNTSSATSNPIGGTNARCYLTKISPTGTVLWTNTFNSTAALATSFSELTSVAVNSAGEVYAMFEVRENLDIDPSLASTVNITSPVISGQAIASTAIVKFTAAGAYSSHIAYLGTGTNLSNARGAFAGALGIDANGNIIATGRVLGASSLDINPGAGVVNILEGNAYIVKLSPTLTFVDYNSIEGAGDFNFTDLDVDANGDIYWGDATSTSPGVPANFNLAGTSAIGFMSTGGFNGSNPRVNGFLAKYSGATMDCIFVNGFPCTNGTSAVTNVTVSNGFVYVVGYHEAAIDADPSASTATLTPVGVSMWSAKYDAATGNYTNAKTFATAPNGFSYGQGIAVDAANNYLYLTGQFFNTLDFDPSTATNSLAAKGIGGDIFMAQYDLNFNYLSAYRIGSANATGESGYGLYFADSTLTLSGSQAGGSDFDLRPSILNMPTGGVVGGVFLARYRFFPPCVSTAVATATATTCGLANGAATTTNLGTYLWSNGATTQTISNLAAGNYTVTATLNGCPATATVTVAASTALSTSNTATATTCGLSNGSISTSLAGTYTWSNGATTQAINNLAAGTYTVTVTAGGCSTTATSTVAASSALSTTNTATATTCGLNNGTVATSLAGTYAWSNGATTQTISNLAAGTYTVTVTAGGCSATATASVGSSTALSTSNTATATTCGLANGTVTTSQSGTYAWSNGATTQSISNLAAGTYTVTVTAGGCTATATASVGSSTALSTTNIATATTCGLNNGSVATSQAGTYTWSNGATTQSINNLAAGTYNVTVTAGGCSATATASVGASTALTTSNTTTDAACGASTGTASTSATGTYLWSNGATTQQISNLAPGTYTVTVTSGTCTASATAVIGSVNNLTTNNTATATTCGNDNGSVTTSAGGAYLWSNGATTQSINNLAPGTYTVTVTSGTCTASATATVLGSLPLQTVNTVVPTTCGLNNGSVSTSATGTYLWSNGATTQIINNLAPGTYSVTVTSGTCTATESSTLNASNALSAPVITNSGTALSTASGFVTYNWYLNGTYIAGVNTNTYTPTVNGNYTVEVINADGCTSPLSAVEVVVLSTVTAPHNAFELSIYPNPTTGLLHINAAQQISSLQVIDAQGRLITTLSDSNITSLDLAELPAGLYTLKLFSATDMVIKKVIKH
jgi:hypothetical protein